jgi:hypothetical protein
MKLRRDSASSSISPPSSPWAAGRASAWAALLALAALSATACWFVQSRGWTLWYGDSQAHLSIARRIFDSRSPGYEQIGTVWLPLPHLFMLPLVRVDDLWRTGLGGAIPAACCFVAGGWLLFLTLRRILGNAAAFAGTAAYALNPNLLYLQSTPMTESMSMCFVIGVLYFSVRFRDSKSVFDAALAGLMACLGSLTRYEMWFLLPFVLIYFLHAGGRNRWRAALAFSAVAGVGPLYWLAHNQVLYSDALEFFRGPWSAKAIYQRALDKGMARYPGDHNWVDAWRYYLAAATLCLGKPLTWLGLAGVAAALYRRAWWAVILLALTPVFYVLSIYGSGTPIFVPHLWPSSYYNTRYGLTLLPLACLGMAAVASLAPAKARGIAAAGLLAVVTAPWLIHPSGSDFICWKESEVNSTGRRAWTHQAAEYLGPHYKPGQGILMSFGDSSAILREAGIPLKESLHEGDGPLWLASVARPDLFMQQEWAIATSGDSVSRAMNRMGRGPRRYQCVRMYSAKDSPVIEIWRHIQ